uniref:Kinesin-like protein n=1 Tax=Ditylenchus dipsaci TaxID=166011 RepID=A0A915DL00_9BILA
MAGYNGTIFAYGQTGSGKTYTMFGPQRDDGCFRKDLHGLIPRCMDYLFDVLNQKQEENGELFKYSVTCSFVQLYNENLYDLLDNVDQRLKLRSAGDVEIEGAVQESINTTKEVMSVLSAGYKNRRTAETSMNRESSRSHAIFLLHLTTEIAVDGIINRRYSRLNLVDLAGSERQQDSLATENQLKEAGHINKSLSTLTRVIRQLSKSPSQYPGYRDSQLTLLLKDSLGGNSRTAVIINLHPNLRHSETTASSLYFSDTVKRIKNKATVNENVSGENVDSLKNEILRLKEVVRCLKEENSTKNETIRQLEDLVNLPVKVEDKDYQNSILDKENIVKPNSEQTLTELERTIESYKNLVAHKDQSIQQYESSLTYKSHRVDILRQFLEDAQLKQKETEEENEQLKKSAQFQKIIFEKEKLEKEMSIRQECRHAIEELKLKYEEVKRERDTALNDLTAAMGHQNQKQKISYVNQLRERLAHIEKVA